MMAMGAHHEKTGPGMPDYFEQDLGKRRRTSVKTASKTGHL
jgi:hypothetical protein